MPQASSGTPASVKTLKYQASSGTYVRISGVACDRLEAMDARSLLLALYFLKWQDALCGK